MNKLKVGIVNIGESCDTLEITEKKSTFIISGHVQIKKIKFQNKSFHSTLKITQNASLDLSCQTKMENIHGTIDIECEKNTKTMIRIGMYSKNQNNFSIKTTLKEENAECTILIRMVGANESHTKIKTTGVLETDAKNSIFLEDIKYLMEETNEIKCIPELFLSSSEVTANHKVTIGKINEEDLFYLKTKGINEELGKELIRQSFLKNI